MSARIRQLLTRPITERHRQRAFAAAAVALLTAGALTLLAPPAHEPQPTPTPTASRSAPAPALTTPSVPSGPPAAVEHAGRDFLSDYLDYLYGHTRGRTFAAASGSLRRRLASRPPRVSPAMRRRHPRVVSLTGHRLASRSQWLLTATIADGGAARYPIELVIATSSRGAVIVGLAED